MAPRKKGAAVAAKPAKTHNLIDPKIRKEFLDRRKHWQGLNDRYKELNANAKTAAKARKKYEQEIEQAGFTMAQIHVSLLVETPEGEAEFRARLGQEMIAAAYAGAEVGEQLSLFFEPDRTPAIERARNEGQQAAMEHKAHRPPYDPSVPQYQAWSDAFYAEQERQVMAGIKKKEAADEKAGKGGKAATGKKRGRPAKGANAEAPAGSERTLIKKEDKEAKAAAKAPKDAQPPRTAPAAAPVTRATLKAQKEAARAEAESYFTKSSDTAGTA